MNMDMESIEENPYEVTVIEMNTQIPMSDVIQDTLQCNDNNVMDVEDFYVQLLIATVSRYLDILQIGSNKGIAIGGKGKQHTSRSRGKSRRRKKASKKRRRTLSLRTTRTRRSKKRGGANAKIVTFFLLMFFIFVESIRNLSHSSVKDRLKQAYEVIDLFKNEYGTCAANTLLFLRAIDLNTFVDLSRQIMTYDKGMTDEQMSSYFNKTISVYSQWTSFGMSRTSLRGNVVHVENFIDTIRDTLIKMRKEYGFNHDADILTALSYVARVGGGHSVTVWLTKDNDVIIIDPQFYYTKYEIRLFTSGSLGRGHMEGEPTLRLYSIRDYIRNYIDYDTVDSEHALLTAIHAEIKDNRINRWTISNPHVQNAVSRIRRKKEQLTPVPLMVNASSYNDSSSASGF